MFKGTLSEVLFITLLTGVAANALCVSGCGINSSLTEKQQERDLAAKMQWVNKAIDVAERHNLAYRVEVDATGKPSIGETVDLYFDSGVSAKLMMFGNAAAAPKTSAVATGSPADDAPENEAAPTTEADSGDATVAK